MLIPDNLQGHPADYCDERWDENFKFIFDDRVLPGINSPNAPVELQIAMIPVGSLKAQFTDATESLDKAVERYMLTRTEILRAEAADASFPSTEMESVKHLQSVMQEVRALYDAYDLYTNKIDAVRASVSRHLDLYILNGRLISDQLDSLLFTNRHECFLRSYGIERSMKEYQTLEEHIEASMKSTLEVILAALKYFMDIIDKCSDSYENLASSLEDSDPED